MYKSISSKVNKQTMCQQVKLNHPYRSRSWSLKTVLLLPSIPFHTTFIPTKISTYIHIYVEDGRKGVIHSIHTRRKKTEAESEWRLGSATQNQIAWGAWRTCTWHPCDRAGAQHGCPASAPIPARLSAPRSRASPTCRTPGPLPSGGPAPEPSEGTWTPHPTSAPTGPQSPLSSSSHCLPSHLRSLPARDHITVILPCLLLCKQSLGVKWVFWSVRSTHALLPYPSIEIWRRKGIEMSFTEVHAPPVSHINFHLLARIQQITWLGLRTKTQCALLSSLGNTHTPTLRVFFTGKLALGSNTSPFGPVLSKKSGFLT